MRVGGDFETNPVTGCFAKRLVRSSFEELHCIAPVDPAGGARQRTRMQDLAKAADERLLSTLRYDHGVVTKFADAAGNLAGNLRVAVVILIVTFWAAGWVSKLVRLAVGRLHRGRDVDTTLQSFLGSLARYVIVIVGAVAVLQKLGVQATSILAVLGAASLAVGLALQGALSNVAAGVMILIFRPYRVGDFIETSPRKGTVRSLDLFVTEMATPDNLRIIVPNSKVFGDVIVNYSQYPRRRADAVFKLPFAADVEMVFAGLKDRLANDPRVRKQPAPLFEVISQAHDSVELAVRVWTVREDEGALKSDIIRAAHVLATTPDAELPPLTPPTPRPKPAERAERRRLRLGLRHKHDEKLEQKLNPETKGG